MTALLRRIAAVLVPVALMVTACAPSTVGGVRGYTAFNATARVERHHSTRSVAKIAHCFRTTARFLPKSRFTADLNGTWRYTLSGYGLWFEEFLVAPAAAGGSDIEVRTSGAYTGKWIGMLVRDRLEPLGACIAEPEENR